MCDTRNTVSPHRHSIKDFFCAPFPWNTDRTLAFTENTDICCYKKELLTLLVFLICNEINRLTNDFQDFRLSMRSFQQFLTWYDSYCVVRHLLVPKPKPKQKTKKHTNKKTIAFKNYILEFALLFRFRVITQFFSSLYLLVTGRWLSKTG